MFIQLSPSFAHFFVFLLFSTFMLEKQWKRHTLSSGNGSLATKGKLPLPPGPWKLPLIGNLHQMIAPGSLVVHTILAKLAKKYGPIMHLQVCEISMVVMSSPEVAEAVLTIRDLALAQRPDNVFLETLTYNNSGIALFPFGNHWRFFRKFSATYLLNPKRVHSFKSIREEEISIFIKSINSSSRQCLNLGKKILVLTNSIISRATIGKKIISRATTEIIRSKMDKILDRGRTYLKSTKLLMGEEGEGEGEAKAKGKEEDLVDVLL